jgi:hypothetical protein
MRAKTHALIAALALIALVGAAFAAPASADRLRPPGAKAKKIKAGLQKRLEDRGLENVDVRRCTYAAKRLRGKKAVECTWYAEGVLPGEQPYRCHGDSLHGMLSDNSMGFVRISTCVNKARTQIPISPTPVHEPLFGFNDEWHYANDALLDTYARLRPDYTRSGLAWVEVEYKQGTYDWSVYDALYSQLISRGIRPIWTVSAAPCWAQGKTAPCDKKDKPTPQHYDEMGDFAAAAARRYPQIAAFEVWNEPNLGKYWGGTPEPDLYAEMFKAVEAAVEKADPGLPVLFGTLGPHAESDENTVAAAEFLAQGYDLGAVQKSDGISTHPYPGSAPGEDHAEGVRKRLGDLWEVMSLEGDADRPLWITETGVSTVGDRAFSGEEQAQALVAIYDLIRRVPQVKVLVFHRFRDAVGDNDMEPGYGSVDATGAPKPAYCALGATRGLSVC